VFNALDVSLNESRCSFLVLPLIHHQLLWQQKRILQLKESMDVGKFSGLSSCSTCFCTPAQSRERLHYQYMNDLQLTYAANFIIDINITKLPSRKSYLKYYLCLPRKMLVNKKII